MATNLDTDELNTAEINMAEIDMAEIAAPGLFRRGLPWAPILVIPLLSLPVLWVFLDVGLVRGFDTGLHLLRIGALDRALSDGLFLPRWLPDMLLGYGYPLLNYYAPAIYYFVEVWHLAGATLYQSFILTSWLITVAAGFGAYLLAYDLLKQRHSAALVASALYMLAPYLMINIFNRGALSEAGAQALLPWTLWCTGRLFSERAPERYAVGMMLLVALLATMHTISLLFAPLLIASYLLLAWRQRRRAHPDLARTAALWAVGALLGAMALSAFYWLPVLAERGYISNRGFEIARDVWLESGAWRWSNFLDLHLIYENASERPVQLGLVQAALAALGLVIGFWQGMRLDWRWWFWMAVAGLAALLITTAALPLWQSTVLAAAQFPWRMLSVLSLPLALFAGAVVLPIRSTPVKVVTTAGLLLLIVYAHTPRIAENPTYDPSSVRTDAAVQAMNDLDMGVLEDGEGNSIIQEFRPFWAPESIDDLVELNDAAQEPSPTRLEVEPLALKATGITLNVSSATEGFSDVNAQASATPLTFTSFYFPGWRATLNGNTRLQAYPAVTTGLLTVDVPAGSHTLEMVWEGTALEKAAGILSLLAALGIGIAMLFHRRLRWFALPLMLVGSVASWGWLWQSAQRPVQLPQVAYADNGLRLLGATLIGEDTDWPSVRVLWQVEEQASDTLVAYLQVQDDAGAVLGAATVRPWYNTSSARAWPVGAIVDDAYQLPLPAGLPAGNYRLAIMTLSADTFGSLDDSDALPAQFTLQLPQAVPAELLPEFVVNARVGDSIELVGYTPHTANGTTQPGLSAVVRVGDQLRYSLFWRTTDTIFTQSHAFIHLIDGEGNLWAQRDQGPGPLSTSPEIWLPQRVYEDAYQIYISNNMPSGVYTPIAGQYDFATGERLPVQVLDSDALAGEARLQPVKVLNQPATVSGERLDARFGDFASLERWQGLETTSVAPGATLGFTLFWQSLAPTPINYTRFLQIVDGSNRIIGQSDAIPQQGMNPTWSWIPDEIIEDRIAVQIDDDAPAGEYRVIVGLYNAEADTRAPVHTQAGAPYDANAVTLGTLEVRP